MATDAYRAWVRAGRPWTLARPVSDLVALARRHNVAVLGTIGNDDHLQSNNPQDHTPFSRTAWPVPLPGYIVTACDLADGPWSDRILNDARSGRAPWVKYLNFRGRHWNVKNNWVPASSGDQHLHVSCRTDRLNYGDSTWNPFVSPAPVPVSGKEKVMVIELRTGSGSSYWVSNGVEARALSGDYAWDAVEAWERVHGPRVVVDNDAKLKQFAGRLV